MPDATPVTIPVLLTVAIDGVDEVHGLVAATVPEPVSCVVNPTHADKTPVIVGFAFIVIVVV